MGHDRRLYDVHLSANDLISRGQNNAGPPTSSFNDAKYPVASVLQRYWSADRRQDWSQGAHTATVLDPFAHSDLQARLCGALGGEKGQ